MSFSPLVLDVPVVLSFLKAFLWTSSRGEGGYHNVVAFMLFHIIIYIYISMYIYIHTFFFYSYEVFTLAILVGYSALFQCACNFPGGSCVGPEAAASGPGT